MEKAVAFMLINNVKKLPILEKNGEDYKVLGILSLVDIARLHPDLLYAMNEMVESDMASQDAGF